MASPVCPPTLWEAIPKSIKVRSLIKHGNLPEPRNTAVEQVSPSFLARNDWESFERDDNDLQIIAPKSMYPIEGIHPRQASQLTVRKARATKPNCRVGFDTPVASNSLIALFTFFRIPIFSLAVVDQPSVSSSRCATYAAAPTRRPPNLR